MSSKKYRSLSTEEKFTKQQHGLERYKSLFEDENQKFIDYRKKILWNMEK